MRSLNCLLAAVSLGVLCVVGACGQSASDVSNARHAVSRDDRAPRLRLTFAPEDLSNTTASTMFGSCTIRDGGADENRLEDYIEITIANEEEGSKSRLVYGTYFASQTWNDIWRAVKNGKEASLKLPGGLMTFGSSSAGVSGDTVSYQVDTTYRNTLSKALGSPMTLGDLLQASVNRVDADNAVKFSAAGLRPKLNDLIRLQSYHIEPSYPQAWQDAHQPLGVDDLIRANSYHLKAKYAADWRVAGQPLSLDSLIRAQSYHLDPNDAVRWKKAGYAFSLDDLIRANSYHLDPDYAAAAKKSKYEWSLDDLIRANSYHIEPEYFSGMADAGYAFSLDDLIRLKSYHVTPEFASLLRNPAMENLSADEIVSLKQRNIDTKLLKRLRGTPAATQSAQNQPG